jgi:CelD/BcsL family acetyltransferase involved in cellulose biosynthesis
MNALPLLEEHSSGPSGALISQLGGHHPAAEQPDQVESVSGGNGRSRRLSIYSASAGFEMVEELDHLCARTIEPNVFFNPRFLAPAMPRLEDREVRLAVIRDGDEYRSRLRLLLPFSVERPPMPLGAPIIRAWASPFGPLGTPLIDRDDPEGVVLDFLDLLARPGLKLPRVLVLPDMRLDGPAAATLRAVATARGLAMEVTSELSRPILQSALDGDAYLSRVLRPHHLREFRRMKRRLSEKGVLDHVTARSQEDVRLGLEAFLTLEASGWKGRRRTAMAVDRYRAAFAREAVNRLAERDMVRVHMLTLDGEAIACLVVFIEGGVAYTWKTAYDETLSAFSPGTLLMIEVTRQHLDDPNIDVTDSCAVPDHPVMSRLWAERRRMGTMVLGTVPGADRTVRQATSQLHLYSETRNLARVLKNRVTGLLRR